MLYLYDINSNTSEENNMTYKITEDDFCIAKDITDMHDAVAEAETYRQECLDVEEIQVIDEDTGMTVNTLRYQP